MTIERKTVRYQKYFNNQTFHAVVEAMTNWMIAEKLTEEDIQDALDVAREKVERIRMEIPLDE